MLYCLSSESKALPAPGVKRVETEQGDAFKAGSFLAKGITGRVFLWGVIWD